MNNWWIVARKELRSAFQSPVALLFVGVFVLVTLFGFFTASRFFARNIADIRPLFEWLPLLLIFLVSAATMRMWAEERKMGTLEVMLTLPLRSHALVLGKFAAAVSLVAIGLGLTLPLPVMVSQLGDLDWGPVVGGYLGALLLGATYSAIGLAVSARTDNQVVALMLTLGLGGLLWLVGSDPVASLAGATLAEWLRALGTGSRFESIARGVLDARDLLYYATLTGLALFANWLTLERQRIDLRATASLTRRRALAWTAALLVINGVLANVWMAPVHRARLDVTATGEYSLSRVTRDTVAALQEPLFIDAYFSERTHPLLAPLVPRLRDMLDEYRIIGNGRVQVQVLDPTVDPALAEQIQSDYGVSSVPFRVEDRTQQAVVNAYFHLVVRYGDQYQTLSFNDLIEVQSGTTSVDVRLRNPEYDLTRAIRKVSQDFTPIEAVLASLQTPVTIRLYATPDTLPGDLAQVPEFVRTVVADWTTEGSRVSFEEINPASDAALQQRLAEQYAIRPMAVDLFGTQTFYLDLVVENGTRAERIVPRGAVTEGDLRRSLEAALRRLVPGQMTTVGLFTDTPEAPAPQPGMPPGMQPPQRPADYQLLEQMLRAEVQVERVQLDSGIVPGHIDTLLVAKPGQMTDHERFAIDQFLMRGGTLLVFAGGRELSLDGPSLSTVPADSNWLDMLATWGVRVGGGIVMDEQTAVFPVPVREQRGQMVLERIELVPYAPFPDIRSDGFDATHPVLRGLASVTAPWSSPLTVEEREGLEAVTLLRTSEDSWVRQDASIEPNFTQFPETGFGRRDEPTGSQVVAVALSGTFPSWFADRPSPLMAAEGSAEGSGADATGQTLTSSLPGARIAVIGSAEFASDILMSLSQQPGGEAHRGNLPLVQNLLDWAVEDTSLSEIRNAGAFSRTLRPMEDSERRAWELGTVAVSLLLLAGLAAWPLLRRRRIVSFATEVRA